MRDVQPLIDAEMVQSELLKTHCGKELSKRNVEKECTKIEEKMILKKKHREKL
ncbi:MAG: hypothetical protein IIX07_02445 [Lachnospiraceae bacterium]|nr:hypothetical protein [Lachnospiraceae bacterium]